MVSGDMGYTSVYSTLLSGHVCAKLHKSPLCNACMNTGYTHTHLNGLLFQHGCVYGWRFSIVILENVLNMSALSVISVSQYKQSDVYRK